MALSSVAIRRRLRFLAILCFTACTGIFATHTKLVAENFRVETKVFHGDDKTPLNETTTLFHNGKVYDFLQSPDQTAVFIRPNGSKPGRFILLDNNHRIRTDIETDRLETAIQNLQKWASEQSQAYLKFSANPDFKESFEPGSGQLVLASHIESYTVHTEPAKNPKGASEYREFLDWYARLNTLLSGSAPPQPRLELNKSLSRYKAIPTTVELRRSGEDKPLRAEHAFTWLLSQQDLTRIDDVQNNLASYRAVTNEDYSHLTRDKGNKSSKK